MHEDLLKQTITIGDKWDGSDTAEINIGGATSGQLFGTDDFPCLNEDEDNIEAIKQDNKFFANAVCQCLEMYKAMKEFCDRVDKGEVRSVKTYAKFKEILSKVELI